MISRRDSKLRQRSVDCYNETQKKTRRTGLVQNPYSWSTSHRVLNVVSISTRWNGLPKSRRHTVTETPSRINRIALSNCTDKEKELPIKPIRTEPLKDVLIRTWRLIRTLTRVCLAIRRYAINKTDSRVLMDLQNLMKPRISNRGQDGISQAGKGVYFNKYIYSVENNHAFPLWARTICHQYPLKRCLDDLQKLCRYLRGIHTFSQFQHEVQMEICKHVIYNRYDRMRVIINQVCI